MKELFTLYRPKTHKYPIVINVPHAGEFYPDEILEQMMAPIEKCKRDLDLYVDQIWKKAPDLGVTMLVANYSRYVVDLNRAGDDISPETVEGGKLANKPGYYGSRGVVWRTTTDGTKVLNGPMKRADFDLRIAKYHTPYHAALLKELERVKELFGFVIMIDAHSMPSQGRADHPDAGSVRADVVPGNVHGETCDDRVSEIVESHFTEHGYSVAMNNPYQGAWDTRHYGRPSDNQHTIQIELNRKLYMDEKSFEILEEGMKRLSETCVAILPELGALDLRK